MRRTVGAARAVMVSSGRDRWPGHRRRSRRCRPGAQAFGHQEAGGELVLATGGPHRDRDVHRILAGAGGTDLERLFPRERVPATRDRAVVEREHLGRGRRARREAWCSSDRGEVRGRIHVVERAATWGRGAAIRRTARPGHRRGELAGAAHRRRGVVTGARGPVLGGVRGAVAVAVLVREARDIRRGSSARRSTSSGAPTARSGACLPPRRARCPGVSAGDLPPARPGGLPRVGCRGSRARSREAPRTRMPRVDDDDRGGRRQALDRAQEHRDTIDERHALVVAHAPAGATREHEHGGRVGRHCPMVAPRAAMGNRGLARVACRSSVGCLRSCSTESTTGERERPRSDGRGGRSATRRRAAGRDFTAAEHPLRCGVGSGTGGARSGTEARDGTPGVHCGWTSDRHRQSARRGRAPRPPDSIDGPWNAEGPHPRGRGPSCDVFPASTGTRTRGAMADRSPPTVVRRSGRSGSSRNSRPACPCAA